MNKNEAYNFLPFRFKRRAKNVLLANEVGDYIFLKDADFHSFITKDLDTNSEIFFDLKSKGFLYDKFLPRIVDILATKYRTKNKFLFDFTSLHMFVVTQKCNQQCSYCHALSQSESSGSVYDMDKKTALNSVELAFKSPSSNIKIEFQGGEPLLNFDVVKIIVAHAEKLNEKFQKRLEFVVCTNLVGLKKEHLEFFKEHEIVISTSLDGSREIHNKCRKLRNGKGSYDFVVPNIEWATNELGKGMVSALMTVTPFNVNRLKEVVDEYINRQLGYIFIRKMNPFGYAYDNDSLNYSLNQFIEGYKEALDYIIQLNFQGIFFPEVFASILLSRILTPFSTGFVDLQSPSGAGICGVVYDVNGDIFVSDEARMLAKTTKNKYFCIGNVNNNSWKEAFCSSKLHHIVFNSCTDALPSCSWCVYKPYCGSDPVMNFFVQGDIIGHRPTSEFCQKHYAIFDLLFDCLETQNDEIEDVFWSWITQRSINQIQNYYVPEHCEEETI